MDALMNLRKIRQSLGLSQLDLSVMAGCSRTKIHAIETSGESTIAKLRPRTKQAILAAIMLAIKKQEQAEMRIARVLHGQYTQVGNCGGE